MHDHPLAKWQQSHDFRHGHEDAAENRVLWVIAITALTAVAELAAGYLFGSMALVADGWHMCSHAAALGISAVGYVAARRLTGHERFTFGTGKIGPLAGYTSAVLLALVAAAMTAQSVGRLLEPVPVRFDEAIAVAVVGLAVNLVCAWLLRARPHTHGDDHAHGHGHEHAPARDHNLAAAYLHVIADALTSVLAIGALVAGKYLGWTALDAIAGIVGGAIILHWSAGLMRGSARVLLDAEDTGELAERVRRRIEHGTSHRVADLHVWRVGLSAYACIVTIVTHEPVSAEDFKRSLGEIAEIRHLTVEVNRCCEADGKH